MMRSRLLLLLLLAFDRRVASISVSSSDDDAPHHHHHQHQHPLRRTKNKDLNDDNDNQHDDEAQNNKNNNSAGEWSDWLPSLDEAGLGVRFTDAPAAPRAPNFEADEDDDVSSAGEDAVVVVDGAEGSEQLYEEAGNPETTSETVSFCVEPNNNNTGNVGSPATSAEEGAALDLAPPCKLREFQQHLMVSSNDDSSGGNAATNTEEENDQPQSEEPDDSHRHRQVRRHARRNNLPQQKEHSDATTPNNSNNHNTTNDNDAMDMDDAASAAFFSGECGPHCRPSCVTLQLNVERYWYHHSSSPPCRHVRNRRQQQHPQPHHPSTCALETAQCFGPVLYDDAAAYAEEALLLLSHNSSSSPSTTTTTTPSPLPSPPLPLLDRCAAIPSAPDDDDLDRLRDWRVVTPVAVRCNNGNGNNATTSTSGSSRNSEDDCFASNNEDDKILYFEYCHTVREQQALVVPEDSSNNITVNTTTTESCNDDDINSNVSSHQRRTVMVVQPFPDGWTSFVVSASIPYDHPAAAVDEPHQQSQLLPHAAATHRACWAQRVDLYFAPRCPHCRRRRQPPDGGASPSSPSLLQLGDRLGALEVVGFGHAIGQPCAPCDRRSHKNGSATATELINCRDLRRCERLEDCATGERLGLPNFVENQCSFFDSDNNNTSDSMIDEEQPPDDYEPDANNNDKDDDNNDDDDDEDEDDNLLSEEGDFVDDDDGYAPSPPPLRDDDGHGDPYNSTCMLLYLRQLQEISSATTLSKQEICEQASSSMSETEGSCHFCALGGHAAPDTIATNSSAIVELCLNDAQYSVLFDDGGDNNTNNTMEKLIQCSNIQDDYNGQEGAAGSNNTCTRATIQSQGEGDNDNFSNSSNREACWAASPVLANDTDVNQRGRQICYYCSLPETGLSICLTSDQAAISQDAGLVCETSISSDAADNDFGVEAPTSMTNVTDPPSVTTTNETDSGSEDTTVAGSTVVEQQDDAVRQHLLPIVTPIGAALGLALVALLVLLHAQRKRARLTQRELERYRPHRGVEEIVYIDPVELDVIDKVLAPSEDESGFETADESVEIRPTTSGLEERLKNLQKKGEEFSLEVLGESEKPTTAVLKFQSASLVETPGRDEVEALYMTGHHIFTRRRSSCGSP